MTQPKVVPIRQSPTGACQRVEPFVPLVIAETEGKRQVHTQVFHSDARGLREAVNRLDFAIASIHAAWSALHAEWRAFGFQDFQPKFAPWLYWLLIGLAAVLEIPLNENALAMLRMGEWETLSTAAFLAFLNTIGASLIGSRLRQFNAAQPFVVDVVAVALTILVLGVVMFGISDLRIAFMAMERGPEAARHGWLAFTAMQALFFSIALLMALSAHHPDPKIDQVVRDERRYRQQLQRLLGERAVFAAKLNHLILSTEARLSQTEARALRLIAEERLENARYRNTPAPSYFQAAVGFNVFRPIDLGQPIDPHPTRLDVLLQLDGGKQ